MAALGWGRPKKAPPKAKCAELAGQQALLSSLKGSRVVRVMKVNLVATLEHAQNGYQAIVLRFNKQRCHGKSKQWQISLG